jgi:hypothetical protein
MVSNLIKIRSRIRRDRMVVGYTTRCAISAYGRRWSTRREPPTMDKQLVNFSTCDCNLQSRARTHAVLLVNSLSHPGPNFE